MRRLAIAAAMISCGKAPAPVAKPVPPLPPPPVVATCAQATVLVQTDTEDFAALCARDRWSDAARACLAKAAEVDQASACLGQLTAAQQVGFAELQADGARADVEREDEPTDAYVACEDAIHEAELWDPAPVHAEAANVQLLAMMRRRTLVQACNADEWDGDVRGCFAKAHDRAATNGCAAKLPPDKLQNAGTRIARIDDLVDRTVKGEKRPPSCAALVAKHYGDAAWKGKLTELKPAERAKLVARSREKMLAACGTWDAQRKACLFAGGDGNCDAESYAWTYPAAGIAPASTGVAECDAYMFDMAAIDKCTKIPQASRDQMREAMEQTKETFLHLRSLPADQRQAMGESCKYGSEALQQLLQQVGC